MAANLKIKAILQGIDDFTAPIRRAMALATASIRGAMGKIRALAGMAGNALRSMVSPLGLLAGGVGLAGLTAMVDSVATIGDEIGKTARRVGLSTDALQEFRHAASMSGVGAQEFNGALKKLAVGVGQLKLKSGPLLALLKQTPKEFQAQFQAAANNEEAFELLIRAMRKIEDPTKRAAFATAAFGESGLKLVHMAEGGETALADMRAEARRLGLVMSEQATKDAEAYGDSMTRLKGSIGSLKVAIGTSLIPILQPMAERLTDIVVANREVIASGIAGFFRRVGDLVGRIDWSAVYEGLSMIGSVIGAVWQKFEDVRAWMSDVANRLSPDVKSALAVAGKAMLAFGAIFAASPVGAAVLAISLGAGYIMKHWEPIAAWFRSAWDAVSGAFTRFGNYLDRKFGAGIRQFLGGFRKLWEELSSFFVGLWNVVKGPFLAFASYMSEVFGAGITKTINFLLEGWEGFKTHISNLWEIITGVFSFAGDIIVGVLDALVPDALMEEWESVKGFFSGLWDGITDIFEGAWKIIKGIIEAVQDGVDAVMDAANKLNPFGDDGPSQADTTDFQRRAKAGQLSEGERSILAARRFAFGAPALPPDAAAGPATAASVTGAIVVDFKNMPQGATVDRPRAAGPVAITANVGRRRLGLGLP